MKSRFRIVGQDTIEGSGSEAPPDIDLNTLLGMSASELKYTYLKAKRAESLRGLDGELEGHLLTLVGPLSRGSARRLTRRIATSQRFPWLGKTFQSWAEDRGSGINRVRLLGERLWFHFETRLGTSVIDGDPCVLLDYSHTANPWPVRQVQDELRQVGPKLWLGSATLRTHVVLYFALTTP